MADLLRLAFDDGSTGAMNSDASVRDAMADSWEYANTPVTADIEWTADDIDDSDDLDEMISISPVALAELIKLAKIGAQYAGCSTCRRVTLV